MGLTVHYSLTTGLSTPKQIRELLEGIRQFALDLPFESVGEIVQFEGDDNHANDEAGRWLRIQAEGDVEINGRHYRVPPKHCAAFWTWPGQGCEAANFGFCLYPAFIGEKGNRVATKLKGWCWSSFCKTQYASSPECGGIQHFLRCHLLVVKMLDFIKATGLVQVEVSDEGHYWQHRSVEALAKEVGSWNEFLAAFTGELKEAAGTNGQAIEAAITRFPNYEHLEAKGLERLARLRGDNHGC